MPLTLRAVSLNDLPITQPIAASFGSQGGSIGRADTNTLALPDPERRISRRQADIRASGSSFVLENVGSANPIIVRDQSLALRANRHRCSRRPGAHRRLSARGRDRRFDEHERTGRRREPASFADPFAPLQRPPARAPLAAAAKRPPRSAAPFPSSSPFADLSGPMSAGNPFAELLGDPTPVRRRPLRLRQASRHRLRAGCPTISIPSPRRRAAGGTAAATIIDGSPGAPSTT